MQDAHDGTWLQELDGMRLAPNPILVDGDRTPLRISPPHFGEHTGEVLGELGFDTAAIAEMYRTEVVARRLRAVAPWQRWLRPRRGWPPPPG